MSKPCLKPELFISPVEYAAQIVCEHEKFIRWVIRSKNKSKIPEDDIFQDFYLQLITAPVPQEVRDMKGYLYKAILNHLASSYRRINNYEKKIKKFQKKSKFKVNKTDPASALLIRDEIKEIFEFIREISPGQKYMAITLRYRDGYSIKEVADMMGIKYSSASRYISKGLGSIRKYFNDK